MNTTLTRTVSVIFSLFVLVSVAAPSVNSAPDVCIARELVIDSNVVTGQVVLSSSGRDRPAASAEIEMFEFRYNEWRSIGKIWTIDKGNFTWLDVDPGRYLLVAKLEGYQATSVYVQVRGSKRKGWRIIIPLRNDSCAYARLRAKVSFAPMSLNHRTALPQIS